MVKENTMKQTEIGLLPEDWEVKKIFQFSQIRTGGKNTQDKIENGLYPFVVRSQTVERINSYSFDGEAILTAGDGVGVGKVFHYLNGKFDYHQRVYSISNFDKNVSGFYFFKYFQNNFYYRIMQMTAKSSVDSVRMETIADMQIPLPPLHEQEAIAAALSDADAWIESIEQLIAKKRLIKLGAMQELLTPKEDWEVKRLGEMTFITKLAGFEYSLHFNSYRDKGDIIVIRGTNITKNKLDLSNVKTIQNKTSNYLVRSKLFKNDLVFAYVGTIGPIYLVEENDRFHLGPNTAKITVNQELNSKYLYHYFTSSFIKDEIKDHTSIGAQPSLSMSKIRSFTLNFPSLNEQTRIATILSDMDLELEALEAQLGKARKVKQGMMQELLTGRVRLI